MLAEPAVPDDAQKTERRRAIMNEKCKAQSGFFYNLAVAIVTAGPVVNIIQKAPAFEPPLLILSCTLAAFFYVMGNNRLDQMVE